MEISNSPISCLWSRAGMHRCQSRQEKGVDNPTFKRRLTRGGAGLVNVSVFNPE